ncbi:primosomal replication protein N'' [Citrobacter sedlakii]|uniref:Primosomal replication protein N n=1 Tax=Citrobacter sedlakii TaxID=67826 RepID=A0ABS0ZNL7_9ENTR|nr:MULTISPECIES: primosomal replication protein N'' [Citrobacter]KSY33649.1 primosomal replication protein N'' [Citrobacter sp. 50677481]MBJ8380175.1 primosomal replication protein N'' [Citrobacter sedlakii]MCZ4672965.1 primosomal replication protein N'' [Citrobacter sedlakii]MDR5003021.1 primosomal replication protein N'' [Citrobacter sedlakii]HCQ7753853.1 primosomal replication protein N'' [Citrobacter sedlakii]
MKTAMLLQKLDDRLAELRHRCAPLAQHATLSPRFDRQLFQTRATRLQDCVEEAEANLQALRQAVMRQQLPQVAWLAEHLASQLEAIARECESWSLREWDSGSPTLTKWQRKRLQHQEFERRLRAMTQERKMRLAETRSLQEQQTLQREVEIYEGRLARCRKALDSIERVIAHLTR